MSPRAEGRNLGGPGPCDVKIPLFPAPRFSRRVSPDYFLNIISSRRLPTQK